MIYNHFMMDQTQDLDIRLDIVDIVRFNQEECSDINQVELVDLHLD